MPRLALFVTIVLCGRMAAAATIHVPADQPTIQAGIDSATSGDIVLIACGTYLEDRIQMKSGVTLRSASGDASCVTIDAQERGKAINCVGVDATARIEALTITRGVSVYGGGIRCRNSSPTISACVFVQNGAGTSGGAIQCDDGSAPTIVGCTFSSNTAAQGGGAIHCNASSPTITDCTFENNTAIAGYGGGILCEGSSPSVSGCVFSGNSAGVDGGGMACFSGSSPTLEDCSFTGNTALYGGGLNCWANSSPTVTDCTFSDNVATGSGGGMAILSSSSPSLFDCTFSSNVAPYGGGIECWESSSPTLEGCFFLENSGDYNAGMSVGNGSSPHLEGCVFWRNVADVATGAINSYLGSTLTLRNCTFAQNESQNGWAGSIGCSENSTVSLEYTIVAYSQGEAVSCDGTSSVTATCTDVWGNSGGDWTGCLEGQSGVAGNASSDPLFCDVSASDLTLDSTSFCLPANNACASLVGALGEGCSQTSAQASIEPTSWTRIKAAYR